MPTKNLVIDYGAVGDGNWEQRKFTITAGQKLLHSPFPIWGSGDAGKSIIVGDAKSTIGEPQGGTPLRSFIDTFNDANNVVLRDAAVHDLPFSDSGGTRDTFIVAWGTDNNLAFDQLRTEFAGSTVTLTIPSGIYLVKNAGVQLFGGIKNITVNASSATICGGSFKLGSGSQTNPTELLSAKVATVAAGATSVTCLTHAHAAHFTPGKYAIMTGQTMQRGGYPTNHFLYETVLINTVNTTTGVVTFTPALANKYFSTWPDYNWDTLNGGLLLEYGGPAKLYMWTDGSGTEPDFDHTEVINGGTWVQDAQWGITGLNTTLNNCTFPGQFGPYFTMAASGAISNSTCNGNMEFDKLVTQASMTGCNWGGLSIQNAVNTLAIDSTAIAQISGSTRFMTIANGCAIGQFKPGPLFGYASQLNVSDSTITLFGDATVHTSGIQILGGTDAGNGVNVDFPLSAGVITMPLACWPSIYTGRWNIVGANMFWYDPAEGARGRFTINAVTQDASNVYIHTDWVGGYPPTAGGKLYMLIHPAPSVTFHNVSGCVEAVDLSGAPDGLPLYSYTKRNYTGSIAAGEYWPMFGAIKKIQVVVGTAYTGATGTVKATLNGGFWKMSDWTSASFAPVINLKVAGTRTLDVTTYPATWTGGQTGDSLPDLSEATWSSKIFRMTMDDITGESTGLPAFSIEFITDQNLGHGLGIKQFTCTFT